MNTLNQQPETVSLFQWRKLLSLFLSFCLGLIACLMVNSIDFKQRTNRKVSRPLPRELNQSSHDRAVTVILIHSPMECAANAFPSWDEEEFAPQSHLRIPGIGDAAPHDTLTSLRIRLQI
jgi:hypothetical protein